MADLNIPTDLNILVVDDMATMRKIVCHTVFQLGLTHVKQAEDGQVALDLVKELAGTPDAIQLILSDINMPNMSGIELLTAIKADASLKNIPVIMVSAENEISSIMEATSAGAEDFLVKPFTPADLQDKLLRCMFPDTVNPLGKL